MLTLAARHVRQRLHYQDRLYFTVDRKQPGVKMKSNVHIISMGTWGVMCLSWLHLRCQLLLQNMTQFIIWSSIFLLEVCFRGLFTLLIKIGLKTVSPDSCEQPLKQFPNLEVRATCRLAWYAGEGSQVVTETKQVFRPEIALKIN